MDGFIGKWRTDAAIDVAIDAALDATARAVAKIPRAVVVHDAAPIRKAEMEATLD